MCHQKWYTHTYANRKCEMWRIKKRNFPFDFVRTKFHTGKSAKNVCILSVQQKIDVWLELYTCVRMKQSMKRLNNAKDCKKK